MEKKGRHIKRKVLSEYVVEYLVDDFVNKKFKIGERIRETQIASELNVSQGAIREAIKQLDIMGFLEKEPFKGTHFKAFTIKELIDYQYVRAELEAIALEWAITRLNYKKIDFGYLENIVKEMLESKKKHDYKRRTFFDIKFHQHLVQASGSESLEKAWKSLGNYYWAYVWLYLDVVTIENRTIEHKSIFNTLKNRNYSESIKSIKKHFYDLVLKLQSPLSKWKNL